MSKVVKIIIDRIDFGCVAFKDKLKVKIKSQRFYVIHKSFIRVLGLRNVYLDSQADMNLMFCLFFHYMPMFIIVYNQRLYTD